MQLQRRLSLQWLRLLILVIKYVTLALVALGWVGVLPLGLGCGYTEGWFAIQMLCREFYALLRTFSTINSPCKRG